MELKRWSSNQKLEYWKSIENYEGLYMVSSLGKVKSLNYRRTGKEKMLKPRITNNGYLQVILYKNSKAKQFSVHRLVAIAFISNPENKPEVNHINEDKTNNTINNLEWMTSKENNNWGTRNKKHAKAMKGKYTGEKNPMYGKGYKISGEKNGRAKKVRCIETGEIFDCIKYACEWSGLKNASNISQQIRGKKKSAGKHPITGVGLHWEYVDEVELDLNLLNIDNIKISL